MGMMKYNVSDKVVKISDLQLLFNPYHKESYRKNLIRTVTEANESYFTTYTNKDRCNSIIENAKSCGINNYMAFHQETGDCLSGFINDKLLHLEKDSDIIMNIMAKVGLQIYEKDMQHHYNEIKYHQSMLKSVQDTYTEDFRINMELLGYR